MKPITSLLVAGVVVGGLLALVGAPAAAPVQWVAPERAAARKNPVAVNDTSIALGKKVYDRQCASCHGTKGKGDGTAARKLSMRPGDLSSPKLWEQSDGALFWKIAEGHKPMPTFKDLMSDEERWPVIIYVRTLAPKPATPDKPKEAPKS